MSLIPLIGGPSWTTYFGTIALVVLVGAPLVFERGCSYEQDKAKAALYEASEKARRQEQQWAQEAAERQESYERKMADTNARLAAASERLRQRPARVSGATSSPQGCSGAQLYREDGLFLRGEATRAETLRIALERCQAGDG